MKIKGMTKLCRSAFVVAALSAYGMAYPQIGALAQTYEEMLKPYVVPSPSGNAILSKQYVPNGPWIYRLSTKSDDLTANSVGVELLNGDYPGGERGADGLVAGWQGESHLTIGTPVDAPVILGPRRVGSVEITYISYAPDLSSAMKGFNQVTLRNVEYRVQEIEDRFHNIECTINITGIDGIYFNDVSVDITGHGVGTRRIEELEGLGSISIKFSLTTLSEGKSPPLTPTQAKFSDISPFSSQKFPSHGPIQDGMSLKYSWFNVNDTPRIFQLLRNGHYNVSFKLTFDKLNLSYLVSNPIDAAAAAAYQKCEARTSIYRRLFGKELSAP